MKKISFPFLRSPLTVYVILFFIFFLALFLRVYRISDVPPGLNRDEASIGYTAYSLLKTSRDEYGRFLPLSFQSFGDWKLPLYIYGTIPFVMLFGLSEFSVRLLSALAGTLSVVVLYFLMQRLFRRTSLSLLSSFLLAIMPWHLHMSRVTGETNLSVLLTLLGVWSFLVALERKRWWYVFSAVSFALTYYTYHGSHVFTTVFLIGLIFILVRKVTLSRELFIAGGIFVFLLVVILSKTLFEANVVKLSGIGIFGDPSLVYSKLELPRKDHEDSVLLGRFAHNRVTYGVETFFQNYLKSYSPEFLFISGGTNHAHNIAGMGNMYLMEAPFLLLGFLWLVMRRGSLGSQLFLLWLLVAPIASAITKDAPHSTRMFAVVPALAVTTALGVMWFIDAFGKRGLRWVGVFLFILLLSSNFLLYWDRYFVHFPTREAQYWGLGYREVAQYILREENVGKRVVMDSPQKSPYIYLLFYSLYDPARYQKEAVLYPPTDDLFYHVRSFGNYEFRSIDWGYDLEKSNTLVVVDGEETGHGGERGICKKEVRFPDGSVGFTIFERKASCL